MTMKNKLLYIAIFLMGFTSCKKYFEVDNSDKETLPNTFSTVEGFRAAVLGTYGTAFDYYANEFYFYPDLAGNMTDITKTGLNVMQQQRDFTSAPEEETGAVGYIWRRILTTVANANNIIEYAPGFISGHQKEGSEVEQIKAQALFIRALANFDLVRVYAQPFNFTADASHPGVPVYIKNPAPEDAVPRATVKQVYTQIEKDLKEAESLFSNVAPASAYYASKKAVQALLARVYLYSQNWDAAIDYSTQVINSSTLADVSNYVAMFREPGPGAETIFRLTGRERTKKIGQVYANADPTYVPTDSLISLFDDHSDIRWSLFTPNQGNTTFKYKTEKYHYITTPTPDLERYDPIVLRASEMYFIRAEANLAKENYAMAADDMKVIIARGLNKSKTDIVLSETKEDLKRTIIVERAKEFCFEGQNFFDITRMKENLVRGVTNQSSVKRINYPSDLFVLPIPQSEIDANPAMKGNPTVNK